MPPVENHWTVVNWTFPFYLIQNCQRWQSITLTTGSTILTQASTMSDGVTGLFLLTLTCYSYMHTCFRSMQLCTRDFRNRFLHAAWKYVVCMLEVLSVEISTAFKKQLIWDELELKNKTTLVNGVDMHSSKIVHIHTFVQGRNRTIKFAK